ncbi:hypothetical protein CYMTET_23820, partial [Cymbomonas tetramitiformis]
AAGSGGGVLTGTAGVTGVLGIGTVATAGSAPVKAVSAALAGAGGLGASVPSGTVGATTDLGTRTAAAVFPAPAATVDPDAIAAAIATALGGRLDALGNRIAHLEARGVAPAGASLLSGGVAPPEAELLARALRDSMATVESWDVARCSLACADLVHEAAKLRPQLTLLKEIHPFGKLPMKALEANAFPAMVYALPELAVEECELDELSAGMEATQEHWRAFVHLLHARVGEFQHFVKSKVPSFPLTDVMVASFFKKRKRVQCDDEEEEARAAGGGSALLPPLDAARREQLAALGSSFRTVDEDQLVTALRGELAPEDIVRPPQAEEAVVEAKAAVAEVAAVAVALQMRATATTVATADTNQTAISDIREAPAGAGEVPVTVPGPAVEVDMAPVVETEVEGEATLVERARGERESERATIENMERCGTGENERICYEKECKRVGRAILTLTSRAHLVAAAFQDWHDVDFLVRIERDKDEFTTVKEAYGMLRPRYWMIKVLEDLAVLERVVRQYNGRPGEAASAALVPEKTRVPVQLDINCLEIFAVWWTVVLWGHRMSGRTVVVNIDNKSAMYQDRDDWMVCPVRWEELDQELGHGSLLPGAGVGGQ